MKLNGKTMRHLKLYEQFSTQNDYTIINQTINNEMIVNKVMRVVNSLPNKLKNSLKEFFSHRIDVDKIYKIEKKFNIFNKVKDLYDKGLRNINDIINRILPKNESFLEVIAIIVALIIILLVIFLGIWGAIKIAEWFSDRDLDGLGIALGDSVGYSYNRWIFCWNVCIR
jgi:hypothetical protein